MTLGDILTANEGEVNVLLERFPCHGGCSRILIFFFKVPFC